MDMIKIEEEMKLIGEWWSPYIYTPCEQEWLSTRRYKATNFWKKPLGKRATLLLKSINPRVYKRIPVINRHLY